MSYKYINIVKTIPDSSASSKYTIFKFPDRPTLGVRKHPTEEHSYIFDIEDGYIDFGENPYNIKARYVAEWDGQLLSTCNPYLEYLNDCVEHMRYFLPFDPVCFQINILQTEMTPTLKEKIKNYHGNGAFAAERKFYARESQRLVRERETVGSLLKRVEEFEAQDLHIQPVIVEDAVTTDSAVMVSDIRNPQGLDYSPILNFGELAQLNYITLPDSWVGSRQEYLNTRLTTIINQPLAGDIIYDNVSRRNFQIIRAGVDKNLHVFAVGTFPGESMGAVFNISSIGWEYNSDKNLWIPTNFQELSVFSQVWTGVRRFAESTVTVAASYFSSHTAYGYLDTYIRGTWNTISGTAISLGYNNLHAGARNAFDRSVLNTAVLQQVVDSAQTFWSQHVTVPDFRTARDAFEWLQNRNDLINTWDQVSWQTIRALGQFLPPLLVGGALLYYIYDYETTQILPVVSGLTDGRIYPAYTRDMRSSQYVSIMFDDAMVVRNLRRLPDTASLQDRLDIMLGRRGTTLLDGTMIRPQVYRKIVITHDDKPTGSKLEEFGGSVDRGIRGVGNLIRDGIIDTKDVGVAFAEIPKNLWTGYREEFDNTRESLDQARILASNFSSENVITQIGLVETQVVDTATNLIDTIQTKIIETAQVAKEAAEIPGEYVKRTSSQVVRHLAIGTVLASVLLAMYKFGDL